MAKRLKYFHGICLWNFFGLSILLHKDPLINMNLQSTNFFKYPDSKPNMQCSNSFLPNSKWGAINHAVSRKLFIEKIYFYFSGNLFTKTVSILKNGKAIEIFFGNLFMEFFRLRHLNL